jgi:hypothetical protein
MAAYNPAQGEEVIKNVAGGAYLILVVIFFYRLLRKRAYTGTTQVTMPCPLLRRSRGEWGSVSGHRRHRCSAPTPPVLNRGAGQSATATNGFHSRTIEMQSLRQQNCDVSASPGCDCLHTRFSKPASC